MKYENDLLDIKIQSNSAPGHEGDKVYQESYGYRILLAAPPKPSGPGALLPLRLKTAFLISEKSGHLINIIFSSKETISGI